jgi:hypothetical protein
MAIVRDYVLSLPVPAPPAKPGADSQASVPSLSLAPQTELIERAKGLDGADTVSVRGVSVILKALSELEGQTWQQRWQNAGCQDLGRLERPTRQPMARHVCESISRRIRPWNS